MAIKISTADTSDDVNVDMIEQFKPSDDQQIPLKEPLQEDGVFRDIEGGVNFRSVSWQRATILFLKIAFAMSILSVPGAIETLGAVGGSLSLVGWVILNTYTSIVLGDYRNRHPECHTLSDMCGNIWGRFGKELLGLQILVAQVIVTAAGIVSIAAAFNSITNHGTCTVIFSFVGTILITGFSSIRTFSNLGWLTWFGFTTFFAAVLIFVVAVTQQDRPPAAPQTGPFDLGWKAMAFPVFTAGMVASLNIFIFSSASSMYLLVISEMKRTRDYRKAVIVTGVLVGAIYLSFSLVIYRWCGKWISTPVFGSAGPLFEKLSYGISLPGLFIGVGIYQHIAAKYLFVRILRDSRHLQEPTLTHWATWLGSNLTLGILGFIIAEAVPILNYLLGLAAALCFAPFALVYPAALWLYDFKAYRSGSALQRLIYWLHFLIILIGSFMVVGGTYTISVAIRDAYANGMINRVFYCGV